VRRGVFEVVDYNRWYDCDRLWSLILMLNVAITPTAEALLQRLMRVKDGDPALLIELALQYFCDRQFADLDVDTMVGFFGETEGDIVAENEQRWAQFQADGVVRSQGDVADRFSKMIALTKL
jgi:hypothetical protein